MPGLVNQRPLRRTLRPLLLILMLLTAIGCSALGAAERERLDQLAAQGRAAAATAQSAAATAIAGAPTTVIRSQTVATTLVAQARAAATRVASEGGGLTAGVADLRERLSRVQPDANGNIAITITEAELTALLRRDEAAADARVQNLAVTLRDGLIFLTGDLTRPVNAPLAAVFQPYVLDGRLLLTVNELTIGQIALPPGVIAYVDTRLNATLSGALQALPGDLVISDVQVVSGALLIVGRVQ